MTTTVPPVWDSRPELVRALRSDNAYHTKDQVCLLSRRWWSSMCAHLCLDELRLGSETGGPRPRRSAPAPPPLCADDLLDRKTGELKPGLSVPEDVVVVSQDTWQLLVELFGGSKKEECLCPSVPVGALGVHKPVLYPVRADIYVEDRHLLRSSRGGTRRTSSSRRSLPRMSILAATQEYAPDTSLADVLAAHAPDYPWEGRVWYSEGVCSGVDPVTTPSSVVSRHRDRRRSESKKLRTRISSTEPMDSSQDWLGSGVLGGRRGEVHHDMQLLGPTQLCRTFADLKLNDTCSLVLEFREKGAKAWGLCGPRDAVAQPAVGTMIDVRDSHGEWVAARIMSVTADQVEVRVDGAHRDRQIKRSSRDLAPLHRHTDGPAASAGKGPAPLLTPRSPTSPRSATNLFGQSFSLALYTLATSKSSRVAGAPVARGVVTLHNLGNSCFFSSSLHCLAQCPRLVPLLLSQEFRRDLFPNSPCKGRMAECLAEWVQAAWGGACAQYNPQELFTLITGRMPRLGDGGQQDACELLEGLLDGVHHDLNRVRSRFNVQSRRSPPPIHTSPRVPNRGAVSRRAGALWTRHLSAARSLVTDLFHSQLQSEVWCADCGRTSTTFDPSMFLPLPIPPSRRQLSVTFVRHPEVARLRRASCQPQVWTVQVQSFGVGVTAGTLLEELARLAGQPTRARDLRLMEVHTQKFTREYAVDDSISSRASQLWAFELPDFARLAALRDGTYARRTQSEGKNKPKQQKEEVREDHRVVMMTHNVALNKNQHRTIYTPCVIAIPRKYAEGAQLPVLELYRCAQRALLPFIRNQRWPANLEPWDAFSLRVMNRRGDSTRSEVLRAERSPVDITVFENQDYSWGLFWTGKWHERLLVGLDSLSHRDLSAHSLLPVPASPSRRSGERKRGGQSSGATTLADCLDLFTARGQQQPALSAGPGRARSAPVPAGPSLTSGKYRCGFCRRAQSQPSKRMSLWRLPELLVLPLKRFDGQSHKVDTFVDFPLQGLDLAPWVGEGAPVAEHSTVYDLFAVCNHYGGVRQGHYTAHVRNLATGHWWCMSDREAAQLQLPQRQVVTAAAYVLFYARREGRVRGAHSRSRRRR